MIWKYREAVDADEARELAQTLGKPFKYTQFLLGRGLSSLPEIRHFIGGELKTLPLPETMPGMREAVSLFLAAREKGSIIGVAGDFDADGLTATAVLVKILKPLGFEVKCHIPNRLAEGYGLSVKAVEALHAEGVRLLVTVDCGVSDIEAIQAANRLDLPVVITDHHQLPPTLPAAQAIINPHLGGGWEESPLAGVGVAFMLGWAVQRAFKYQGLVGDVSPPLVECLSLVALGTIADMAPLTGVNRVLVRHGLKFLSRTSWPSLKALKSSVNLENATISAKDVGFRIAPRLNAAGRMGSADPALELLITEDLKRAKTLARELKDCNNDRYQGQVKLLEEAIKVLPTQVPRENRTVVLSGENWPRGLLGLVASRVAELVHKPTVMLSLENGCAMGSGRSAPGFDLYSALDATRHLCLSLGGHSEAAGLKLKLENLDDFKRVFEESAQTQPLSQTEEEITVDLEINYQDLAVLYDAFQDLEPFGQGNPNPIVVLRDISVTDASPIRLNSKHLLLRLSDGARAFYLEGYNMADKINQIERVVDLALAFDNTRFFKKIAGWRLVDLKAAGASSAPL
jgi:single-stranded-DNA-specific exonuclease